AIAERQQFGQLAGGDDDAEAVAAEPVHEPIQLGLGTDVDAARWVVHKKHFGLGQQPTADNGFLLITTAQAGNGAVDASRPDAKAFYGIFSQAPFLAAVQETGGSGLRERANSDVLANTHLRKQSQTLAILCDQSNAGRFGFRWVGEMHFAVLQEDLAARWLGTGTEETFE